jgi:hypothetical protein
VTHSSSSMPSVMKGISSSRVRCGPRARAMVVSLWMEVSLAETSSDLSSSIRTCGREGDEWSVCGCWLLVE